MNKMCVCLDFVPPDPACRYFANFCRGPISLVLHSGSFLYMVLLCNSCFYSKKKAHQNSNGIITEGERGYMSGNEYLARCKEKCYLTLK